MMIKKYIRFFENLDINKWIEDKYQTDDVVKEYVSTYFKDKEVNPILDIKSALNSLSDIDIKLLKNQIEKLVNNDLTQDVEVSANIVDDNISESELGKNSFTSFLKASVAIGFNVDLLPDWEDQNTLITFKRTHNKDRMKAVFGRFKSMLHNNILSDSVNGAYISIGYDLVLEYGYLSDDKKNPIGKFKLTKSSIDMFKNSPNKTCKVISEYVNIDIHKLKTLSSTKKQLYHFNPGKHSKKKPLSFKGDILSVGFYGMSTWKDGVIDKQEYETLKKGIIDYLSNIKWAHKLSVNINPNDYWIIYNIKIK